MKDEMIYELVSIKRNSEITLSATLLFSPYPQAYFPQLCITAIVVPGTELGENGVAGERFLDNQRIEGNIPDMLSGALQFVKRNMRTKTIINEKTGQREDRTDYPVTAIREAVINALVHADTVDYVSGQAGDPQSRWNLWQNASRSIRKSAARYQESGTGVCPGGHAHY